MENKKNYAENFFQMLHKNMEGSEETNEQYNEIKEANTVVISKELTPSRLSKISKNKLSRELPVMSLGGLFDLSGIFNIFDTTNRMHE